MKSFLARRIRAIATLKIGIPLGIMFGSLLVVFMVVAAAFATVLAPIQAAQDAVTEFFSPGASAESDDQGIDLADCLEIEAEELREILKTVPPQTDIDLAQAWISHRSAEVLKGIEPPRYDSIITFHSALTTQGRTPPTTTNFTHADTAHGMAGTAGVIDLLQRGWISSSDDTLEDLTVFLVDHCSQ
ncbi:hypothetical protein [Rhodococcus pyridinivorans]|uniref:hypothetical protein n=1 Tax=Rhodococcus pyridinivorans TaxID=103816 RepID=UPI00265917DA|nr:hypothetical protein [Rhodococcus pyridinivorans]